MKKIWIIGFSALCIVLSLQAVVPQKFELNRMENFLKGKFEGISVSYDGVLSLSLKEEIIEAPPEEFYLSFLPGREGTGFLGTGHGGKIYQITSNGEIELYFKVPEMDIYCLAQDAKGNIYAGSSPNGKIYKITDQGKGEEIFNPPEKYIWDLMVTGDDSLLAAVGERGGIYEISPEGRGKKILEVEESHILCLKKAPNGDLIAGSGGKGIIYQITSSGKVSVLFESPYEEIKSIEVDDKGYIYAGAGGEVVTPQDETSLASKTQTDISITVSATPEKKETLSTEVKEHPSTLYRITPRKTAQVLWHSEEELIYTLFWDQPEERLIFGTGNQGRIYVVDLNKKSSLLLQKDSQQVYSFYPLDQKIYVISNNPASVSILSREQRLSGEYVSQVLDAQTIATWGRICWKADVPEGTTLQIQSRSGNSGEPNKTWSEWSPPYQKSEGEQILSPQGRYLQFKVMFNTQSGKVSPVLQKISLFYLQANVSPQFTELRLLPANEVYLKPPPQEEEIWGEEKDIFNQDKSNQQGKTYSVGKKVHRKGYQTIIWDGVDKNEDIIFYSLYIKKEDEKEWRILKENWTREIFAFNTYTFPDGEYQIKVVASDSLSNPPEKGLKSEQISRSFVIDNSLPQIKGFQAVKKGNQLQVKFTAADSISYIKEVKCLIRPGEWQIVFPEDGICDSPEESFNFSLDLPPNYNPLITVKVRDSHDNVGVHRATF